MMKECTNDDPEAFLEYSDLAGDQINHLVKLCYGKDYIKVAGDVNCVLIPSLRAQIKDLRLSFAPIALSHCLKLVRETDKLTKAMVSARKFVANFAKRDDEQIKDQNIYAQVLLDTCWKITSLTESHQKRVSTFLRYLVSFLHSQSGELSMQEEAKDRLKESLTALVIQRDVLKKQLLYFEKLIGFLI